MRRLRRFAAAPFVWLVTVAVAIEIVLIPIFLLTAADRVLADALAAAGIAFNTDLAMAIRIMVIEPSNRSPAPIDLRRSPTT